jgi:hypothetical protein
VRSARLTARAIGAIAAAFALVGAACDSTSSHTVLTHQSAPTSASLPDGTAPAVAQPTDPVTTAGFVSDPVPQSRNAADSGCLDERGTLRAHAADWYPADAPGSLLLGGSAQQAVAATDPFQVVAGAAVHAAVPSAVSRPGLEYSDTEAGCVTHRYASFTAGPDEIVVSAWRVESAANPQSVPDEQGFTLVDNATLVSEGPHMIVVLMVAPDGTTARVTAYGAHARDLVAGWPTTVVSNPSAPSAQAPHLTVAQLRPIAAAVLAHVTG